MARASSSDSFDTSNFDVDSFCSMIHRAIPKAVKDGRFVLIEPEYDQAVYADSQVPVAMSPPRGFVPRLATHGLKAPKLRIPKISVPKLKPSLRVPISAPSVGAPMSFTVFKQGNAEEESSAERMEMFKKGVQKMLHVVKKLFENLDLVEDLNTTENLDPVEDFECIENLDPTEDLDTAEDLETAGNFDPAEDFDAIENLDPAEVLDSTENLNLT
ncbi:unnamed protein product [Parnassius apollo]|uniref:(apollo) hypothetical protein n=1 Tax=Parnassius apollo TaxID=110799 RepID=A0A8S3XJL0_PARAO|nr:unnamed protein product [Parnassius apollo]